MHDPVPTHHTLPPFMVVVVVVAWRIRETLHRKDCSNTEGQGGLLFPQAVNVRKSIYLSEKRFVSFVKPTSLIS